MKRLSQVVVEVDYGCNSSCAFCYNCWNKEYETEPEMDLDGWRRILGKLPEAERYSISGGEPLLRGDLPELIDLFGKKCKHISVLTNGTLIDDGWAKVFKMKSVFVQVPIHGLEATHDKLVGVLGGYRRAIKGIAYLKKNGVQFAVSTVANRMNAPELKSVFELAVAVGASELLAIRFIPGGRGMTELMMTSEQYKSFLMDFDRALHHYRIIGALGIPNLPCIYPEDNFKAIMTSGCSAGIEWIAVDPSGRVRLCNHSPTILGDLKEQGFSEIWKHPLLESLRKNELLPESCKGCDKNETCRGGCRAGAETLYGDWRGPDPLFAVK